MKTYKDKTDDKIKSLLYKKTREESKECTFQPNKRSVSRGGTGKKSTRPNEFMTSMTRHGLPDYGEDCSNIKIDTSITRGKESEERQQLNTANKNSELKSSLNRSERSKPRTKEQFFQDQVIHEMKKKQRMTE